MSDIVRLLQVGWSTWNEMCDFIDVGRLRDGRPEGTYLDENDNALEGFPGKNGDKMGILFPSAKGLVVAPEGSWIVKMNDRIFVYPANYPISFVPDVQKYGAKVLDQESFPE